MSSSGPPGVLVIASDTIGERMAGSGIRYWNLARVIGAQQPVTLATPNEAGMDSPAGVTLVSCAGESDEARGRILAELIADHDVVVAQHLPYLYADAEVLERAMIALDLYAPWALEKLEYSRIDPERGEPNRKDDVTILQRLLSLGDFFFCASERQRDYWLGALTLAGRLDLARIERDPELRNLIDVVPFGLPGPMPVPSGPGPRDIFPAIGPNDPLLIWNGGLWNWLDPLTAIRAVGLLAAGDLPTVRLVFMGTRSPGAQVAEMSMVEDAYTLARDLGLLDTHVFFNEWTPYHERHNWLLQSDIALSLHYPTLEARFSFRTRVLDNLWCGVPTVATIGDVLAEMVETEGIGITVRPGDPPAVAEAIQELLQPGTSSKVRSRIASVARRYSWERVAEPLLRFCANPWRPAGGRLTDASHSYVHDLERMYAETASYARHLESAVDERDRQLRQRARGLRLPGRRMLDRLRNHG